MANITSIIAHHFGTLGNNPYVSTKNLTWEHINNAHKERWNGYRPSKLNGSYVGYNAVIFPDGTWKQARLLGEETIGATGKNFDSFHVAMAGNFTVKPDGSSVDMFTAQQAQTLKNLIIAVAESSPETVGLKRLPGTLINTREVVPHRKYAPTNCYGTAISDYWVKAIVGDYFIERVNILKLIIQTLTEVINRNKLGKVEGDCMDHAIG